MKTQRYFKIPLIFACIVLVLLVLSDFGLIFDRIENETARIFTHIGIILGLISTIIQLRKDQNK